MNGFKLFAFVALFVAVAYAEEAKAPAAAAAGEEETIKVYKRLIPADVLRGKERRKKIFWFHFETITFD